MSRTILYLIVFLALIGASCRKKEYPESSIQGSPVFYFKGKVNNVPVSIQAGVDKYYMYSSFEQDINNVYGFIADLKQEHCSNCSNSIQIHIKDFRVNANKTPAIPDSAFYMGYYPYSIGSAGYKYYNTQFAGSFNKGAQSWNWNFGDGKTSNTQYPINTFRIGRYNTCLTVFDSVACSSNICNTFKFGIPGANCRTYILATPSTSNTVSFNHATAGGVGGYSYLWTFGDNTTSTTPTPIHGYGPSGLYSVSLRAIDNNPLGPDTAFANYNTVTQGYATCAANFKAFTITPVSNPFRFSNIIIKWTDTSGNVYTSDNSNQPTSSYFQVLSSEDYIDNETQQKTKKLRLKFKCMVYCATSTSLPSMLIDNSEAMVTVAYN